MGLMHRWLPEKERVWRNDQRAHVSYDHRAMNDTESAIQSMRWARANLFIQPTERRPRQTWSGLAVDWVRRAVPRLLRWSFWRSNSTRGATSVPKGRGS